MPASPKLYLDENVHKQVASSLRLRGYSVISAHEEENWGLTDQEQFEVLLPGKVRYLPSTQEILFYSIRNIFKKEKITME